MQCSRASSKNFIRQFDITGTLTIKNIFGKFEEDDCSYYGTIDKISLKITKDAILRERLMRQSETIFLRKINFPVFNMKNLNFFLPKTLQLGWKNTNPFRISLLKYFISTNSLLKTCKFLHLWTYLNWSQSWTLSLKKYILTGLNVYTYCYTV